MPELPTLTTKRLILRPIRLPDAPLVQKLAGEKAVAEKRPISPTLTRKELRKPGSPTTKKPIKWAWA